VPTHGEPSPALAAAAGAVLTYGWISISRMVRGSTALGAPTTAADIAGQVALLLAILLLVLAGSRRTRGLPVPVPNRSSLAF
jgi:hypothetical protein